MENGKNEFKVLRMTKDIVNDFEITIQDLLDCENNKKIYCEVISLSDKEVDCDNIYWSGYLTSNLTAIEVYHALTSEKRFYLNDELILSYTIFNSEKGHDEETKEEKACEYGVSTSEIKIKTYKKEIYKHENIA